MRILFATSEVAPLIKTGGLADVSAALPAALHDLQVDVRILLPGYPQVLSALSNLQTVAEFPALPGFPAARLLADTLPNGVPLWVIECPELYKRGGGAYQNEAGVDWPDNAQRFGLLSRITALLGSAASPLNWHPDVVHCNDWQTGLAPVYLHGAAGAAPCVMTVHNLAFQGIFPPKWVADMGLPKECFKLDGVEFYGSLSFMKAGLFYADHITTVSPAYAKEIQTEALGFGLQGLLYQRRDVLTGILNGIDTEEWNPATDPRIVRTYSAYNLNGKSANKRALQRRMQLQLEPETPLFGLVSRFTEQKGLDVVLEIAPQLAALPAQLVLLGSGDEKMQHAASQLARDYPGQIGVQIGFNETLSHMIEAGADIFLMPSRFEPCGLNQLYSQRYGTPPLVHATGGLIDTVVDCNKYTLMRGSASGFVFKQMDAATLLDTVVRAIETYHDIEAWHNLQLNCMRKDSGWRRSAAAYLEIYARVMKQRAGAA
ncbi:MAG: glycogen synthase GlgA [Gallionellaceae bacterium]|nr:glycogen synthase GlgA [Gallionellaceae bacterium]